MHASSRMQESYRLAKADRADVGVRIRSILVCTAAVSLCFGRQLHVGLDADNSLVGLRTLNFQKPHVHVAQRHCFVSLNRWETVASRGWSAGGIQRQVAELGAKGRGARRCAEAALPRPWPDASRSPWMAPNLRSQQPRPAPEGASELRPAARGWAQSRRPSAPSGRGKPSGTPPELLQDEPWSRR